MSEFRLSNLYRLFKYEVVQIGEDVHVGISYQLGMFFQKSISTINTLQMCRKGSDTFAQVFVGLCGWPSLGPTSKGHLACARALVWGPRPHLAPSRHGLFTENIHT